MTNSPHAALGLIGSGIGSNVLRAAADYERDQLAYGRDNVNALQEMSAATPWDRATWIDAWTHSLAYLIAQLSGSEPDATAWLNSIRELAESMTIPEAIRQLNGEMP